jgi:bile acid:Na+ symporter, BASS family
MEDSLFATLLLPVALAVIMTSLGMSLTVDDFRRVVVYPRGVSIGLANLVLISPLLAFAIAEAYSLEPALAVGLVLLGASPGGTMANLLTHLARGDTALSITMTAISSIAPWSRCRCSSSCRPITLGRAGWTRTSACSTW